MHELPETIAFLRASAEGKRAVWPEHLRGWLASSAQSAALLTMYGLVNLPVSGDGPSVNLAHAQMQQMGIPGRTVAGGNDWESSLDPVDISPRPSPTANNLPTQ